MSRNPPFRLREDASARQARPTIKIDLAEEAPDEAVGQTLGRYKLLERVGEGGCGVVGLKLIKLGMDNRQATPPCASAKQPIDPLDERDDQRCLSLARFYRDVWADTALLTGPPVSFGGTMQASYLVREPTLAKRLFVR